MTTQEQLDRLTNIVDALATSAAAHDKRIEALLKNIEQDHPEWAADRDPTR